MSDRIADDRIYAAELGHRYYYDRSITAQTLLDTFADTTDPLVEELLDLVLHEPARTGMLGVRADEYQKRYWPHVEAVLTELQKGPAGSLSARGRFSIKKILWIAAVFVLVAGSAADHIAKIVGHLRGTVSLGALALFVHISLGTLMTLLALGVLAGLIRAIRLFQAERDRREGDASAGRPTLPSS